MRLQPVTGTPFKCQCLKCNQSVWAGDGYNTQADLDGKAFEAYYCKLCVSDMASNEPEKLSATR